MAVVMLTDTMEYMHRAPLVVSVLPVTTRAGEIVALGTNPLFKVRFRCLSCVACCCFPVPLK